MIELKGIIVFYDQDHKHVDVVVAEDPYGRYRQHRLGVDIKPNRGKILTFLGAIYDVPPGDIIWPDHIEL